MWCTDSDRDQDYSVLGKDTLYSSTSSKDGKERTCAASVAVSSSNCFRDLSLCSTKECNKPISHEHAERKEGVFVYRQEEWEKVPEPM